jgi:hypothetical protein
MPENCRHWQGLLAEYILVSGADPDGDDPLMSDDLAAHLAGCLECQATAAEFRSSVDALAHTTAPSAAPIASPISSGLSKRISTRIDQERHRRIRRRRFAAGTAAAAALLVVVSLIAFRPHDSTKTAGERVALSAAGIHGDATLETRAWGTQIQLALSGFIPGQHYSVWLEKVDGTHVGAGSFIGVRNSQINIVLSSALPSSEAMAIGISKSDGGDLVVRKPLD